MKFFKKKKKNIKNFEFKCSNCEEIHKGIPNLGSKAPIIYFSIPKNEIEKRVKLTTDTCILDNEHYFVKACLEIPLIEYEDFFSFGAWVSLSKENFEKYESLFNIEERDDNEPMFGWFSSWFWPYYEDSENIKSLIYLRNNGKRPYIELEPTNHPLSKVQSEGIRKEELIKIVEHYLH